MRYIIFRKYINAVSDLYKSSGMTGLVLKSPTVVFKAECAACLWIFSSDPAVHSFEDTPKLKIKFCFFSFTKIIGTSTIPFKVYIKKFLLWQTLYLKKTDHTQICDNLGLDLHT